MHMTRITVTFYKLFEQLALYASISNTYSVLSLMNNYDRFTCTSFFFKFLKKIYCYQKRNTHSSHYFINCRGCTIAFFFKIKIYQ